MLGRKPRTTGAYGNYLDMMAVKVEFMGHVIAAYKLIKKTGVCDVNSRSTGKEFNIPYCMGFAEELSPEEFDACLELGGTLKHIIEFNAEQGFDTRASATATAGAYIVDNVLSRRAGTG